MINYEKFTLDNGLKVIVHKDESTPIVALNILYNVGARDEDENKTGFAHLFEHLMFGGSVNIPNFDEPLQRVGGENNAFTNNDVTNYYITVPKNNLETAFWLESDRMLSLAFSEKSLEVQRNVVIEEFKQRYLNQPYGDLWLILRPWIYKVHPYKWATIGKEISHIENATMDDVKSFFHKFYCPNNAVMVVAGNVETQEIKLLSEKWFAGIPKGPENNRNLPVEPKQKEAQFLVVERNVPSSMLIIAFHMSDRMSREYYTANLISDVLSSGNSSRFNQKLVKELQLFSDLDAYILGSFDNGLFVVSGMVSENIDIKEAEEKVWFELLALQNDLISENELNKVKNKLESQQMLSELGVLDKAMNLAFAELLKDASMVNEELDIYNSIQAIEIQELAKKIFRKENSNTLHYLSNQNL